MRERKVFQKYLILLAVIIFPLAGYLTVSHTKTCRAQAICIGCYGSIQCISATQPLSTALNQISGSVIIPAIAQAAAELAVYILPMTTIFAAAVLPEINWTANQFKSALDTLWYYNVLPSMQSMTRELSTANAEQSYALGAFADAVNFNRRNRRIADMEIKDHRALRPDASICMAGTMMSGMTRATSFSAGYNEAADVGKIWRSANDYDKPSHGGMALDMQYEWQHTNILGNPAGYVPFWCNAKYNNGHAGCGINGVYVNQDVDVAGMVFGEDTIPLTKNWFCKYSGSGSGALGSMCDPMTNAVCRANANPQKCYSDASVNLDRLVFNLAEPFVKDPVTVIPGKGGKAALLKSVSYKAKRQVVYDGLNYVISRRVPAGLNYNSESTNPSSQSGIQQSPQKYEQLLAQIRALTGESNTTGGNYPIPNLTPDLHPNPSRDAILRALMTQRFRSGLYSVGQINEPENNQREMVVDQALQVIQLSDDLDLMDHEMLLLASQVSTEIQNHYNLGAASGGAPVK